MKKLLKEIEEINEQIKVIEESIFVSCSCCVRKSTVYKLLDLTKQREELYLQLLERKESNNNDKSV